MSAYVIPDAVLPLSLQRDGEGWTIWDARSVAVLRTESGHTTTNRDEAERLLPGGKGTP